jgi:hypothetical protein
MLTLLRRLAYLLQWRRHDRELAEEIAFHEAIAGREAMGNVTLAREDARDVWVSATLWAVWRDAVYAVRTLRREPTFAATALLTLTFASLITIAAFSVANAEVWRPLPFPDAQRLVVVEVQRPGAPYEAVPGPDFLDWTRACRLASYAAERSMSRRVLDGADPQMVRVLAVTTNFFTVLGRTPSIGRGFTAADATARTAILYDG